MPRICSNDARMKVYDFMNRAGYRDTYSAFGRMSKLAFDPGRFSVRPGNDWDRSQLLKMSIAMDSISNFL